jgi:hypothetical protein
MNFFSTIWNGFIKLVHLIFPTSPFAPWIDVFAEFPFWGYLNWFFPVGTCLSILSAWLTAYGAYLLYSIIARWCKIIE